MDPRGSVALVTGGSSGLGLATTEMLVRRGAQVVIIDLPHSNGRQVEAAHPGSVCFMPADVRDPLEVAAAVEAAVDRGPLRIVVNCAGVGDPGRTVGRNGPMDLDRFRRVVDINLVGSFNVIRLAVQAMLESAPVREGERGVVVNTASVAAFDGQVGQASYAGSKAGIVGMTLPLAREFAQHGVRVLAIAPGTFETPILAGLSDTILDSLAAQVPHPKRMGRPDEFGALVEHMIDNAMLNGEVVRLDGAIRMAPQ